MFNNIGRRSLVIVALMLISAGAEAQTVAPSDWGRIRVIGDENFVALVNAAIDRIDKCTDCNLDNSESQLLSFLEVAGNTVIQSISDFPVPEERVGSKMVGNGPPGANCLGGRGMISVNIYIDFNEINQPLPAAETLNTCSTQSLVDHLAHEFLHAKRMFLGQEQCVRIDPVSVLFDPEEQAATLGEDNVRRCAGECQRTVWGGLRLLTQPPGCVCCAITKYESCQSSSVVKSGCYCYAPLDNPNHNCNYFFADCNTKGMQYNCTTGCSACVPPGDIPDGQCLPSSPYVVGPPIICTVPSI